MAELTMKELLKWQPVLVVVLKALLAGLLAVSADQVVGGPVAGLIRPLVAPSAALGAALESPRSPSVLSSTSSNLSAVLLPSARVKLLVLEKRLLVRLV